MALLAVALVSFGNVLAFPIYIHVNTRQVVVDFSELFRYGRVGQYVIDKISIGFERAIRSKFPASYFVHDKPSSRDHQQDDYSPRRLIMCLHSAEIFLELLIDTKPEHVPCRATLALIQAALLDRRYYLASLVQGHSWLSHARTFHIRGTCICMVSSFRFVASLLAGYATLC